MTSPSWTLVRVFGKYTYRDGSSARGSITFSSTPRIKVDGELNLPKPVVANLRKDGSFETYLPATDDPDLSHVDWVYTVTELFNGGRAPYMITVPHTAPFVDLVSVVPLTVDPSTPQEDLVAALAQVQAQVSNAAVSATAAAGSATAAGQSATTATGAATAAQTAKTAAETAASAADASSQTAAGHATVAANSAAAAGVSAGQVAVIVNQFGNMATVIGAVEAARDTAQGYATTANTKAGEAATSASAATTAQTAAEAARDAAIGAATTATTKAGEAATSATNASTSAGTATTQATNAGNSATAAATSATNAGSSASSALSSASAASGSATAAATSATNASNSASTASTHATTATTAKTQVEAARDKAQLWADAPQGTEVEAGGYSAKHWALQAQASSTGTLVYMGAWAADSGSYPPAPNKGHFYKVSTAGSLGAVDYATGDQIIYNGTDWDKVDNTEQVTSVAGRTGAIVLTKADVGLSLVDNTADSAKSVSKAATLTTARTINGTSFNGSANITTASWGTSRNFTLGSSTKAVSGAANMAWTLAEIGAAAAAHGHAVADVTGLQAALDGKQAAGSYALASHNHSLDSLNNVTITANSNGEILRWNGTAWINNTLAEAGIQPALGFTPYNATNPAGYTAGATWDTDLANIPAVVSSFGALANAAGWLRNNGSGTLSWTSPAKADVGLGNADNTSDAAKPISSATQTALDAKAPLTGAGTSGTWPISITGNAATATTATSATSATSAATLTTARTLTIGGTGKTFNGSANVSWSLAEIGALADAPSDGKIYGRKDATWVEAGSGGVTDAPSDGKYYGRRNGAWGQVGQPEVVTVTANTTLNSSHLNKVVEVTVAGLITLTIPPSLGAQGDMITIVHSHNTGDVTITRGSGVAIYRYSSNSNQTITRIGMMTFYRTGTTNTWLAA